MFSKILLFVSLVFVFLLPGKSFATYFPTPCLTIGGVNFFDCSSNLIALTAHTTNGAGVYTGFRKFNTSAGYTPSGSKKFRVWAAKCTGTGAAGTVVLTYATADPGLSGSAPAGLTYFDGNSSGFQVFQSASPGAAGHGESGFGPSGPKVPNADYLVSAAASVTSYCFVWGYEEP